MNSRLLLTAALPLVACAGLVGPASAQRLDRLPDSKYHNGADVRRAYAGIVAAADQATVGILCAGKPAELGTVVDSDGWILTKYSELRDSVVVRLADRKLPAKVVGYDIRTDLAILKIDADNLVPIHWTDDSLPPQVGQFVATACPEGLPRALGVISLPPHSVPPGGPVLGIELVDFASTPKIELVSARSHAAQAGLKPGDIITRLDDKPIDSSDAFVEALRWHQPGDTVALDIYRGEQQLHINTTLAARPPKADRAAEMDASSGPVSRRHANFPIVIQHDSTLRPEDCGGPLVDLSGNALGINIARAGRIASYAIPADQILCLLPDLKAGKLAPSLPLPKAGG